MVTYGEVGTFAAGVVAGVALTADTEITVATIAMPRGGTITEISWNYDTVIDAKAATGYMELKSNLKQGPWRWPIGTGCGGSKQHGTGSRGTLKVDIPVQVNEIITICATMTEDCVAAHVNIEWEG